MQPKTKTDSCRLPTDWMELEDVQSDLQALRKLYGLLQRSPDDVQRPRNEFIIAASQSGALNTACSSKPVQSKAIPKLPLNSPKISNASPSFTTASKDKQSLSKQTPPELFSEVSRISIPSNKSENRKKRCRVFEESNMMQQRSQSGNTLSRDCNLQGSQNKVLRPFCSGSGPVKRLSEAKEKDLESLKSNGKPNKNIIHGLQCNVSTASSVACFSSSLATGVVQSRIGHNLAGQVEKNSNAASNDFLIGYNLAGQAEKKSDVSIDFSKEVANAIERIESQISALQLGSDYVEATNNNAVHCGFSTMPSAVGSIIQTKEGLVTKSELCHAAGSVLDKTNLLSRQASQRNFIIMHQMFGQSQNDSLSNISSQKAGIVPKKNVQASKCVLKSNEPLRQGRSQNAKDTQLNVSSSQRKSQNVKAIMERIESLSGAVSQTSQYVHGLRVPQCHDDLAERPPMPPQVPSQFGKDCPVHNQTALKERLGKVVKSRPSMPLQSTKSVSPVRPGQKKSTPNQMIMKQTLLDQESQTWFGDRTDRKWGGTNRVMDPQSKCLPHQQESEEQNTSSSSPISSSWTSQQTYISDTESEAYSSPSQTQANHMTGSTSRELAHEAHLSSSEECNSSYSVRSHYKDVGPPKACRSRHCAKSEKPIGRLRRFKNKLGLIFHHHHHHYHHHHDDDDDNCDHAEGRRKRSKWKHLHNIFHHQKSKRGDYEKQAVDKSRKLEVSNVPRKHQVGHFHALVEGLMRHIKHSKKSKRNGPRGHNSKVVKKLHWWQMFKRHGGVKLPNKGRVKIGFRTKSHSLEQLR